MDSLLGLLLRFPENAIMVNKFVFNLMECLRAFPSQLVDSIEQAWFDREPGLGALYRF